MVRFLGGILLPLLLLTAALLNWSLISLANVLAFLLISYSAPGIGFHCWRWTLISYCVITFSFTVIFAHAIFHIIVSVKGEQWCTLDAQWVKLFGFIRDDSLISPCLVYFLVIQLLAALVALADMKGIRYVPNLSSNSSLQHLHVSLEQKGSHLRVVSCFLLPAIQLVAGIIQPSWVSLPFFFCSCIGLVNWSFTSNFLGLFWWWRYLLFYAGLNIVILYLYQLPFRLSSALQSVANFIRLYRITSYSDWSKLCSGISLLLFYFTLSCIRCDLSEMDAIVSMRENSLTEHLLPPKLLFLIRESRSGIRHTNILLWGAVFRTFTINFFTYGFPISLFALSFWSVQFASLCSFGLLAYVGYFLYTFPSLFIMHRLNGLLLVLILFWAISTYVFNLAFTFLHQKLLKDMEIWETIGLWRYPLLGLFILAQFWLGILVAMGIVVNSSVFLYLSDKDWESENGNCSLGEKEQTAVLLVAIIAWALRKSSRAIMLVMTFLNALNPGLVHAVYMVYFLIYLLSHAVGRKIRQSLILFCEAHFVLLYILRINLISQAFKQKDWVDVEILPHLGFLKRASSLDFIKIATLACLCAVYNNGFDLFLSFSAIMQHTPFSPIGWSILKAGFNKSILSFVYSSAFQECGCHKSSHDIEIALYLNAIGQKILSAYRSCGTYIVCLTILLTVYFVKPNYASFGYLFFLLLWMNGRQLIGKTRRRLWFPLKVYAITVFFLIYSLSVFPSFKTWFSQRIDLYPAFGYDPDASMLKNVWESLAVLVVIQLHSVERRLSKSLNSEDFAAPGFVNLSFLKRLLIWHSEKILFLALFYASLSPIGAFGFVYLLGLVICSTLPKSSKVPSKLFIVYSGFVLMVEYLFQLWGEEADMFPGQSHSSLSLLLGLQMFHPSFIGLESGMRGEVLVIAACILQYNVFHWLDIMPCDDGHKEKWEEPCVLFRPSDERLDKVPFSSNVCDTSVDASPLLESQEAVTSNSLQSSGDDIFQLPDLHTFQTGTVEHYYMRDSYKCSWASSKENHKWNKRWIFLMKKERQDLQKASLKLYLRYMVENMFNIFGLEINMVALLVASFAVLNAISLLYIVSLAACMLIPRHIIRRLWPIFVLSFALVLAFEYLSIWLNLTSQEQEPPSEPKVACNDCWKNSKIFFDYCKKCWLGIIVDDPRMLVSYFMVFVLASFKLRADHLSGLSELHMYLQLKKKALLGDLSFDTKSMWTAVDNLTFYSYCHLLDLVLALVLITGTLEYDILHLGYLGFALTFFRMRLEILKKKNRIFNFLRMYNFALIVFSLAYQSPFIGDISEEKREAIDYVYDVIGFYKYDYGFRITSRSALVEIIIFMLVSLQSYMFATQEFDYISKYLEAEQVDGFVREQEKRASWKTAQLHHIRKSEEQKRLRNLQVEKMKSEMLNLQIQLQSLNMNTKCCNSSPEYEVPRRWMNSSNSHKKFETPDIEENNFKKNNVNMSGDFSFQYELEESPRSVRRSHSGVNSMEYLSNSLQERSSRIESWDLDRKDEVMSKEKKSPLTSAIHLFGDGVSEVKSLGNKAISNLVNFLNIKYEEPDLHEQSSENDIYFELDNQYIGCEPLDQTFSVQSDSDKYISHDTTPKISFVFRYILAQIRSNNDIVCYCFFVVIFLWNFSLLSTAYIAALYLFALCVNTGPGYMFWIIMLVYSEVYILLQYLYQIIIRHCGFSLRGSFLKELGFPEHKTTSSFVISILPLFLVYIFTLIQTSIAARDGDWVSVTEFSFGKRRVPNQKESSKSLSWWERLYKLLFRMQDKMIVIIRNLYVYWKSLAQGAETPPYFVQLSMEVNLWPNDGIQPERIESRINKLLEVFRSMRCKEKNESHSNLSSIVRIQSIERSQENPSIALAVFEVVYASPLDPSLIDWYKSLTPAADVANEILNKQ